MPSPFPGMDPYLEHPGVFPDVHDRLITHLSEALQARLPEPYFAVIGERLWVETSERTIQPDVDVVRPKDANGEEGAGGGVALAIATRTQPIVITVPHDEKREPFVEIRMRGDTGERVVTAIEVLSLSNKTPGEKGRELYLKKQREVQDSTVHLVEIDLLRDGQHTTAVPHDRLVQKAGAFDYHVSVCPGNKVGEYLVYAFRLNEPLPEIVIPLLHDTPPVTLDLQLVFERCYEAGPYRRRVRYGETLLVPPLRPEQAQWAAQVLREKRPTASGSPLLP